MMVAILSEATVPTFPAKTFFKPIVWGNKFFQKFGTYVRNHSSYMLKMEAANPSETLASIRLHDDKS
jgi:hypothetical protein